MYDMRKPRQSGERFLVSVVPFPAAMVTLLRRGVPHSVQSVEALMLWLDVARPGSKNRRFRKLTQRGKLTSIYCIPSCITRKTLEFCIAQFGMHWEKASSVLPTA